MFILNHFHNQIWAEFIFRSFLQRCLCVCRLSWKYVPDMHDENVKTSFFRSLIWICGTRPEMWSLGECYRSKQQIWVGSFLSFSHQFAQRAHHKHISNSFSALVKYFLRQVEHLNIEYWGFSSSNEAKKFSTWVFLGLQALKVQRNIGPNAALFTRFIALLAIQVQNIFTLSAQFKHKQFILWRYYSWLWGFRRERFTGTAHMKEIHEVYISINI